MVGGIIFVFLSNTVDFSYASKANCYEDVYEIVCYGTIPDYDVPIKGTYFIFLGLIGLVIFGGTYIVRSRLKPSLLKNSFICCLLLGLMPMLAPVLMNIFSYFPGPGFFLYILSLISIISALVLFGGIKRSKTSSVSSRKLYSSTVN